MKVLVYGAGVIGSVYGARLQAAGHAVTMLGRPARVAEIREHGLAVEEVTSGVQGVWRVATTDRLEPDDRYDVALIAVRYEQIGRVLPELVGNQNIPVVIFMVNQPEGTDELARALGVERVVLGFPGVGGALEGRVVRYTEIAQQPTTLGGVGGRRSEGVRIAAAMMRGAGLRVRIESDMEAWLCAHAFFVTCVCGALYLEGGDRERLSRSDATVGLMVDGVGEGFRVMGRLGRRVHPLGLKAIFGWMPGWIAVRYWRSFFADPGAEYSLARHARHAPEEMRALSVECRRLAAGSGVATPALERLYRALDEYARSGAVER